MRKIIPTIISAYVLKNSLAQEFQTPTDNIELKKVSPVVINTWVPNGYIDAARNAWKKLI